MTSLQMADAIMEMWNGDYNNDIQIAALREDGVPIWREGQEENEFGETFGGFLPVNSHYRVVDIPAFGERVLYLEEFTFKNNPYRQRLYTVTYDAEAETTRVKLWYFKDKTRYKGAWKDLSAVKLLKPSDMSPLPDNCDMYVTQTGNGRLQMKMPKNQCKFGDSIFDYQVSLSSDSFWFRDRIVDSNTQLVKVTAGSFAYHKLDKISN
ncbi:MAG: chromophore lyase CpcT/CpeT [Alphaproteobacteria bacterium]